MRSSRRWVGWVVLAAALVGCGGSIKGNDGGTTTPCSAMSACECMAASDRCTARTEACWCPSECNPQIACICGGGRFLACDPSDVVAVCTSWLAAVQAKCANQPGSAVADIGDLCTRGDPICVSGCLANLNTGGSCTEIDCSFCRACDCAPTDPSPFASCIQGCTLPPR